MRFISLDYETFYIKNEYSVRDLGNWRYCQDERFDPYFLTVYDGSEFWAGNPVNFNWDALEGATLGAHNAAFDSEVTLRLAEQGRIPKLNNPWLCTANMTSCIASSRSLADAMWVLRKVRLDKGIRDEMNKRNWKDICAAGMRESVTRYALDDTRHCFELYRDFGHLWSPFERELSDLTINQCRRGVAINVELLEKYREVLQTVIFNLVTNLPWTERGAKPTSTIAIAEECRKVGIPCPPIKTKDEEGFDSWETTYGEKYHWVLAAGQWRQLNKLLGFLDTIRERLKPDNTIDFSLLYFGGHTGRWSGGGAGLNMQNLRKSPLFIKDRRLVTPPAEARQSKKHFKSWLENCVDMSLDVRRLFIARPGKKFILCDLSQIEPRVLNWLAGNHDLLKKIAEGFSYYEACAVMYKGWKGAPGTLKASLGDAGYTLLKNEMLGLGYGMGPERFADYAGISLEQAEETVAAFRANNPRIAGRYDDENYLVEEGIWQRLERGFRDSVKSDFVMELPSGRTMTYRNVTREKREKRDRKTGQAVSRWVYLANTGMERSESYGGLLCENLVQATARDVFGEHLLELEKNIGDVIWSVHDEAITEVDLDVKPKDVEQVMSQTPAWLEGCPLAAEAKETPHYLK